MMLSVPQMQAESSRWALHRGVFAALCLWRTSQLEHFCYPCEQSKPCHCCRKYHFRETWKTKTKLIFLPRLHGFHFISISQLHTGCHPTPATQPPPPPPHHSCSIWWIRNFKACYQDVTCSVQSEHYVVNKVIRSKSTLCIIQSLNMYLANFLTI